MSYTGFITEDIGNVFLFMATIPAFLAVMLYCRRPWWRSPMGRHAMTYMGSVAALLVLLSIRNIWGSFHGYNELRAIAFICVLIALWWRLLVIMSSRRQDLQNESEERHEHELHS